MRSKTEHILSFIQVVEQGSFTQAAEATGISKAVISQHVSALEALLEVKLLTRTTRSIKLTDLGQVYFDSVRDIPQQLQTAEQVLMAEQAEPFGELNVVLPENFAASLQQQVIPEYLKAYPKVSLNIESLPANQHKLMDNYDIHIMWKLANENFPSYNLVAKKLLVMNIGLYATKRYLKQHGEPQIMSDLLNHNCFSTAGKRWPYMDAGLQYINVDGRLQTSDEGVVLSAVLNDLGIAYSYPFVFDQAMASGEVKAILPQYTQIELEIFAFYKPTNYLPKKISAFLEFMQKFYQ